MSIEQDITVALSMRRLLWLQVLEPHLISALPRSVQQLMMLGDEKQLRPKVNGCGEPKS